MKIGYTYLRLWNHIQPKRRRQIIFLIGVTVLASFAEVVSIGAVLPFLAALMAPEKMFTQTAMQPIIAIFGLKQQNEILLPLTVAFIFMAILAAGMRLLLLHTQTTLGHGIGADFSYTIYRSILRQPYSLHASRNSSEIISTITGKTNIVIYSSLIPLLTCAASLIVMMMIFCALVFIDPMVASLVVVGFGGMYLLVMLATKNTISNYSRHINQETTNVIKVLQEGLGGIRDIILQNSQDIYCEIYSKADIPLRNAQARVHIISGTPRYLIESIGIAFIAILAFNLTSDIGVATAIPVLGGFAIGAQRLLPVLQQIYSGLTNMRSGREALNTVLNFLDHASDVYDPPLNKTQVQFSNSIELDGVSFKYAKDSPLVIKDVTLSIKKGSCVGIIGRSGSGKSTIQDLIMGLLSPTSGSLAVDGVIIDDSNRGSWQSRIAHVPQNVFLSDSTIAENIAFGVPKDRIDLDRVKEAARKAQLSETIELMKLKYETNVGESGGELSGGQRQRIGIARAFYRRADILFFDEATSSLDSETERCVMDEINSLDSGITKIIITHKLENLIKCDSIFKIDSGSAKYFHLNNSKNW